MANLYVMKKGVSSLADLKDGLSALSMLMAAGGKWYYCDPNNGNANGDGRTAETANSSLEKMYSLCRSGYNDGVLFIGGVNPFEPTVAFDWSNNYCHLIGLSGDIPGVGQRCRYVAVNATPLSPAITFSGSGCVIRNMQFNNEKAAGAASGVAVVTGFRNIFENVFFMSPTANDAASYSLKLGGSENTFVNSTIGQFTNPRTGASYGLWLYGPTVVSRNKFIHSEFLSWGYNAGHVHVLVDSGITVVPWVTWFEDCLFQHNGTALTQAIDDNCTAAGHQIIFRGRNNLVVNAGVVGDVLTYMFAPNPDASISGLLAVPVAEG